MRRKLEVVVPLNWRSRTPGLRAFPANGGAVRHLIELWDEVAQGPVLEPNQADQGCGGKKCLAT
jgi:hypothetical protein